jgi:AraC-like DNA-binding protein
MGYDIIEESYEHMDDRQGISKFRDNAAGMAQILDLYPFPIEVFDRSGMTVFANRAMIALSGSGLAPSQVPYYNILLDPIANDEAGLRPVIERAFCGETIAASSCVSKKAMERLAALAKGTADIFFVPLWGAGAEPDYVVCTFVTESYYTSSQEAAKAKEYIDINWQDPFDAAAMAGIVFMHPRHLDAMFAQRYGLSMLEYYHSVKVSHIKERLCDEVLTITEAFYVCGADIRSGYSDIFEEYAGESPWEYRKRLGIGQDEHSARHAEGGADAV